MSKIRNLFTGLLAVSLLLPTILYGDISLQRVPVQADYENLILQSDNDFHQCAKLLMGPPKAKDCAVMLVRSDTQPSSTDSTVAVIGFSPLTTGDDGQTKNQLKGYMHYSIASENLADRQNVAAYLRPTTASIMDKKYTPPDATVVVVKGSGIGADTLIRHSADKQFIVEQESTSKRFAANMRTLAARQPSTNLSVFDFAPRTQAALDAMNIGDDALKDWQVVTKDIDAAIRKHSSGRKGIEPRTVTALKQRLTDLSGGVVLIYGHSDGDGIFLDTADGIHRLTTSEIREIGAANGNKLPPVILLNCYTREALAPAFLVAGSPLVVTSDRALPIVDIRRFIDGLSRHVYRGTDVIDAFYDVQADLNLVGIRAIAALSYR